LIIKKKTGKAAIELKTADGHEWQLWAKGNNAVLLISRFAHALGMNRQKPTALAVDEIRRIRKIVVSVSQNEIRWRDLPVEQANEISCQVGPIHTPEKTAFQLTRISQVVANYSEKNGGLLVHGALAEWNGQGVILAGPGGVGKTTASKRLPHPWRSLSDDNTLIVKSPDGSYWAHPWPTWSQYRQGKMNGSWDVQAAVKLRLICMLTQNKKDRVSQLPTRQAISEMVDVSGQTFFIMANGMDKDAIRRINLLRFENAITMSKWVPICRLEISRNGKFWKEIEKFLVLLK
jgi:SynChlorMet cassette protein ScmC